MFLKVVDESLTSTVITQAVVTQIVVMRLL